MSCTAEQGLFLSSCAVGAVQQVTCLYYDPGTQQVMSKPPQQWMHQRQLTFEHSILMAVVAQQHRHQQLSSYARLPSINKIAFSASASEDDDGLGHVMQGWALQSWW